MKVKQLYVHPRQVRETGSCGVLAKSVIVIQPHSAAKLAVGADKVLHQILPPTRKVEDHDQGVNGKGLHPARYVLDPLASLF